MGFLATLFVYERVDVTGAGGEVALHQTRESSEWPPPVSSDASC